MQETHWILLPVVLPLSILRLAISRAAAVLLSIRHFGDRLPATWTRGSGAVPSDNPQTVPPCPAGQAGRTSKTQSLYRRTCIDAVVPGLPDGQAGQRLTFGWG